MPIPSLHHKRKGQIPHQRGSKRQHLRIHAIPKTGRKVKQLDSNGLKKFREGLPNTPSLCAHNRFSSKIQQADYDPDVPNPSISEAPQSSRRGQLNCLLHPLSAPHNCSNINTKNDSPTSGSSLEAKANSIPCTNSQHRLRCCIPFPIPFPLLLLLSPSTAPFRLRQTRLRLWPRHRRIPV